MLCENGDSCWLLPDGVTGALEPACKVGGIHGMKMFGDDDVCCSGAGAGCAGGNACRLGPPTGVPCGGCAIRSSFVLSRGNCDCGGGLGSDVGPAVWGRVCGA